MRLIAILMLALLGPVAALAECDGQNLISALPADQRATLQAAADAVPFARGNIWHATRGGQHITLVGTYHLDDPRHQATLAALEAELTAARVLLIEAGPDEEAALRADLAARPDRLLSPGPTLPEALSAPDWARLSLALTARGIPPVFAAKLQPWYVATLLALPACQFALSATTEGLDKRLMASARAKGVPVKALEPYDTLFAIFDQFTAADQIDMLLDTLRTTGGLEADMAATLADSYFAGQSRLFWEFSRAQMLALPGADPARVARQFALVDEAMMAQRNRKWIAVITAEAARGPVVVAFGALHLSGEAGVLNLLQAEGFAVTPW